MEGEYPDKDQGDADEDPNPQGDNPCAYEENIKQCDPGTLYEYSFERFDLAKNAIDGLNEILAQIPNIDAQVSLVEFSGTTNTSSWAELPSDGHMTLPESEWQNFNSGTNYRDALQSAQSLVRTARADDGQGHEAETVVVFITDGEPNRPNDGDPLNAAIDAAGNLTCDRFYVVGVGGEASENTLQQVTNGASGVPQKDYLANGDASNMLTYFAGIASDIAGEDLHDVMIVDELSEYAQLTAPSAVPVITITDAEDSSINVSGPDALTQVEGATNGVMSGQFTFADKTTASGEAGTQTLTYTYYPAGTYGDGDNAHSVVTLEFPDEYRLTDGWTYTITFTIEPTDQAYVDYAQNNGYLDAGGKQILGDQDTDAEGNATSSNKPGFHANTQATLHYTTNEAVKDKTYPHPVIQVTITPVSALPLTGGDTTARNIVLAGGGVLLLAGAAWLLARRRRV
nr:vWA domain-containing protein [Bifidobacterium phasiani]